MALQNCTEVAVYIARITKEVSGYLELKINSIMDNKSFIKALYSSKNTEDTRLCWDVAVIKRSDWRKDKQYNLGGYISSDC